MDTPRYAVNCSIMMKDRPLEERLSAVREAGFGAVELWWPFPTATPSEAETAAFTATVRDSGLRLVGLNLYAGDMPGGDRGVLSWPGHEDEVLANARTVRRIAEELDCRAFNALYGNRRPDATAQDQDAVAVRNLGLVAAELGAIGGTVLIEPVSGTEAYPLKTADDAVAVIERVERETGATGLGLLLDVYHLATNGDDVSAALERHRGLIRHVQLADAPGRGAPGTGGLALAAWVEDLVGGGYDGWIALEHAGGGDDPFAWTRETDLPGVPAAPAR
ncbi:hydroxypyruvate isomerase [Nocardiopsis flavescens]|uniref:Hydroxypyruvate isomerase n=1 Tax=Nocardiopsis flavescens TaxID=758803 RepID=A0A1M6LAT9_9ACTN|nr:TIM barrel protein [Nocardiopsis flavescens]SHJ68320.1 hydroxypyruvate isomerase [Nocardiopsis flavescens]